MKFFLILPFITMAVAESLAGDQPNWADENRFGDYQNAWKSLGQEESTLYYLINTTYQDDTLSWGANFSCVVVKETSKKESEKMVTSRFVFKNASSTKKEDVFQVEENVKAVFFYNYTKNENAIEYLVEENEKYIDPLIYSDEACDIFYVPYANGKQGGLELWVNGDHISKVPQHCSFLIEYFRRKEDTVYTKYSAEECGDVVEKIRSPK